jgi:2-polyprenyl-3-methyl-5-hydroxy-6-metoxy-1,4-benzoquinol methylase
METLESCPICNGRELQPFLSCTDFVATGERFQLQKCRACTFLFTNPRPESEAIGRYYQSDRYVSHSGKKSGFIYKLYDIVRDYSIGKKLRLIKRYHAGGKLMDLGCGLGYFLDGVYKDGSFSATGVDISTEAINYVRTSFGHDVLPEELLDTLRSGEFDVITQWHVLEHVHLVNERMQQLKRLMKKDGTLFIAVPNCGSLDARFYKEYWDAYDVPRHLYHFNKTSFFRLMSKHGFKVVDIKPLLFDAPYVSMRSETHKGRSMPFLMGGIVGTLSNLAGLSGKNYSSLLYIVKNDL